MLAVSSIPVLPDVVGTDWLFAALTSESVKVIDARWFMPGAPRTGRQAYDDAHIPGAVFFDIDGICDRKSALPHMLPDQATFETAMGALGVRETDTAVVYDGDSLMSAPRVWWTLRRFGHERVAVLDGGLRRWIAENRPVTADAPGIAPARYTARPVDALVTDLAGVRQLLARSDAQVIDARSRGRFEGREPEPRAGLRRGHMPGSRNLPFPEVLDPATGRLLAPAALASVLDRAGIDTRARTVVTCGSGVTACVIALALARAGNRDASVYDGAWAEWGSTPGLPVAVLQG